MSGGADMFRVLSQTEDVVALIADTRPAVVVDRTGSRLLWANAAGASFFGVATIEKLTTLRFSPASPFARRIAALDNILVSGQDRIERLPLQRGLLPRPTVCKASRVVAEGIKAILLSVVDGTGSFAGDPAAAFAALTATARPEAVSEPVEDVEATAEQGAPNADKGVDELTETAVVEPIEATSDGGELDAVPERHQTAPAVDTLGAENSGAAAGPLPEDTEITDAEASGEVVARIPDPTEEIASEVTVQSEPVGDIGTVTGEALPETGAAEPLVSEEVPSEPAEDVEVAVEETRAEPAEVPPSVDTPAFTFPVHGRAVRFVFELDPQLTFTFVSADLAATVGPGMADILDRTWAEVAGRLEFDPAGRIAEALGRRDTFTGLTVDWPVEGENLRVPADLAGMPVFGRERSFRGYRGFGVLKTGAAFEAPVPAEPIAVSEPDGADPIPAIGVSEPRDIIHEVGEPAADLGLDDAEQTSASAPENTDDRPSPHGTLPEEPTSADATADEPSVAAEAFEEPLDLQPTDIIGDSGQEAVEAEAPVVSAELVTTSEEPDRTDDGDESVSEETAIDLPDAPAHLVPSLASSGSPIGVAEVLPDETESAAGAPAGFVPEDDLSAPAGNLESAPVVADQESVEADELPEPLPLVTPPPEDDTVDAIDSEPAVPPAPEVVATPATPHRTTFASLTGDKARALSKPERDAFDKIAEALADAFGPRILAETPDRAIVPQAPVPSRKAEAPADSGPTVDIALLDKLPVALAILRGGDIIHANKAFLDLCGYPDVASIDADGGFAQVFEGAALNRDASIPAIRRRDGVEIPVSARLHSMPMDGGIASLLVVQETVATTSRDRLATAEQRAEDMEAILDTATDGVLVLDQKGLVIGANKSAEALFGNERSHMIGMAFVDLLAPESHRSALDYLDGLGRNALSSVLNDGREVIGRVAGGGLVPLFMTVGRVSATKFCAVLRDITQWKRAEEELTSAKKAAENASSQKSDFLAKMSHEIRTPLNAIIGFSEVMMEERFGPIGNDRYKEYLRDIHVSGTHIMSLVNDLLDLSKIEAGKLELTFEAVGLNDVVRECAALMQPQANRERIIIRTSLSSSLPPVVADNRSLRQIILNLLSNAVKFNSAGGQVIVSTLYEETGEVVLRVRDTGQGMSEGDIVKAMEPFRQLSTSRTGGGTGLGLPLTKALVEANRAAFQIDSTPGQGTMIQITFPSTRVLAE